MTPKLQIQLFRQLATCIQTLAHLQQRQASGDEIKIYGEIFRAAAEVQSTLVSEELYIQYE